MEIRGIIDIDVEHIHPHPDNPRKDLGDISELVESIRKNGIMQNLTVIPQDEDWNEFTVIIGHRRLAASKEAGVRMVPCRIVEGMTMKEQVGTMLEENMQRNDLTIWEQAQGFQMMMDLGETEESIAEKTGFSRTTIRHRLNIAKLNQDTLKKKEQDECFQLTLKDLYELEKVSDIDTRNRILKEARDSRDLIWRAQNAASEEKRKRAKKQLIPMLKKLGIQPTPKGAENEIYSAKWDTVKEISLDKELPEQISIKCKEPMFYTEHYRTMLIIKKAKKQAKPKTEHELQREKIEQGRKKINARRKEMAAVRKEFIRNVLSGKIEPLKDESELQKLLWEVMLLGGAYVSMNSLRDFYLEKESWKCTQEEKDAAERKARGHSVNYQMLIFMVNATKDLELADYNGEFKAESGRALKVLYKALALYGFSFESDEEQLLDGTHELYVKKEAK